jgi:hypothetical protein
VTTTDITTMPLTEVENTRLLELENVVSTGMQTFVEVGNALVEIRDDKLYRQTHLNFAAYVKDMFDLGESHAYRLMDAAKVAEIVSPIGQVSRESHARALVGLEPDQVRDVWQQVNESTDDRPTAAAIAQTRERVAPKPVQTAIPAARRRRPLPDQFRSAAYDLDKVARRIAGITGDNRFGSHAEGLSSYRNDLIRARDALQATIDLIPEPEPWVPPTADRAGDWAEMAAIKALNSTMSSSDALVITYNHNSAFVANTSVVREALQRLGIQHAAAVGGNGRRTFPLAKLDAVVTALQNRGIDAHVVNEVTGL